MNEIKIGTKVYRKENNILLVKALVWKNGTYSSGYVKACMSNGCKQLDLIKAKKELGFTYE